VRHLHVSCDGINAVRGISFQVYADQIVTLIGANGAGKSTTLRAADVPEQMEGDGGVAGMELSAAQIAAIDCRAHALSIVACAGSGKTEVLARRVVRHLRQGVPAESIVAFTFTEKAAAELKTRIDERAGEADPQFTDRPPSGSGLFAGTIHSYCLRLLQSSGKYEVHDVLTEEREWALLYRFARRLGLVELYEKTWPENKVSQKAAVDAFLENLTAVYGDDVDRRALSDAAPGFAGTLDRYERLASQMRLFSFDRIISIAVDEMRPGGVLRPLLAGKI